jgi:hypothetical protein
VSPSRSAVAPLSYLRDARVDSSIHSSGTEQKVVDLLVISFKPFFRASIDPERCRVVVFEVLDVIEHKLGLAGTAKATHHKDLARPAVLALVQSF